MLNHITDAARGGAAACARGRLYDLGRVLDADVPAFPGRYFRQTLVTTAHHPTAAASATNRVNWITEQIAGTQQLGTHLDALSHLQIGDRGYNGWTVAELAGTAGVNRLGVETVPQIVTRGWLVDVCAGSAPGDVIGVPDIDPAPGDAVLFHTGWGAHWDDAETYLSGEPGPGRDLAEWLAERGVALTGCDTWSYGPVPAEDPDRPFEVPQLLNAQPRRVHRREPRHVGARARRRARVRADPHPPEAARRHRRVDLADRPRLSGPVDHYDVIIIGTGAGGGTLAHRLAPSGKKILLLERGGYLPREPENWDSREVFGRERYVTTERWYDKHGVAFRPHAQYFVGGNTKVYGGILFRLRERDFQEVEHYGGVSPAWPISYADLEPYYTEAERLYLVHGQAGEDPTEPPRSGPFPYPAVSHEPRIQQLHDDLASAGHQPFHLPLGVDLDESDPDAGRCVRCNRFDGFPCLTDGKADAHVVCVRPALKHPNVTLRTHARVHRLEPTPPDARSAVVVDRGGSEETYSADIVVVSCGAANSAALLLRSASDKHPNGLANSSDVVGRHYMAHLNSAVIAISQAPNDTKFQKTLGLNDYYWGADDSDLPLGHIQMLGKSDRDILRAGAPWFAPGRALDYVAKHAIDFWLTTEDLPDPHNRVTVDRQGNIHLAKTYHNTEPHKRLLAKLKDLLVRSVATRPASRAGRCSASRSRSPASHTTAAPCASAPIPRGPRSTSTAKPTTSTTSTSSTPASSHPRAP